MLYRNFISDFILVKNCMYQRTGLLKLRRVLRAIRKHFLQPPEDLLAGNPIDKFLDDPDLCEDKLSEEAGSDGFLETITKIMFPDVGGLAQYNTSLLKRYKFVQYCRCFILDLPYSCLF